MLSAQEKKLQRKKRFDWYANQVKFKFVDDEISEPENPTPVFPALNYTKVSPPLETFDDNHILCDPTDYIHAAVRLSLHVFFSLPAKGLDYSRLKKRTRSLLEMGDAEPVSGPSIVYLWSSDQDSNMDIRARELFHRVVMSQDSKQMNLDETYREMNEFVKGANYQCRGFFWGQTHPRRPLRLNSENAQKLKNSTHRAFEAMLTPIFNLFSELWGNVDGFYMARTIYDYKNQVDEKDKTTYTAIPFALTEDDEPFVCIEVEYPFIDFNDPFACSEAFTQAVTHCICSGTPYGIATDYVSTLCFKLELQEGDLERVNNFTHGQDVESDQSMFKYVKVSYVRVKNDAPVNTLACVLAAHVFNARRDMIMRRDDYRRLLLKLGAALQPTGEEMIIRDRKSYYRFFKYLDKKWPRISKRVTFTVNKIAETVHFYDMIPFDESKMRIIQEGQLYNAQVLEINNDVFKRLTANVRHTGSQPGTLRYLLKFFDPVRGKKVHSNFRFTDPLYRRFIKHTFFRELVGYRQLKSLWGKCIPRLYHAGICHLSDSDGLAVLFGGLFLIVEFIEGSPPDFSREEIQQSARVALKAMHDLGVAHGDIDSRNMIQHKDQVFFLDFGLSTGRFYKKTRRGRRLQDVKIKDQEALEKAILNHPTRTITKYV